MDNLVILLAALLGFALGRGWIWGEAGRWGFSLHFGTGHVMVSVSRTALRIFTPGREYAFRLPVGSLWFWGAYLEWRPLTIMVSHGGVSVYWRRRCLSVDLNRRGVRRYSF